MSEQKLLIIGGSGLVGSTLVQYAFPNYNIHVTFNTNLIEFENVSATKIDLLGDRKKIIDIINTVKPDITINTVAHSNLDLCETNHQLADILHVDITRDIALACKNIGSKLIYISTDAVFPGKLNTKYTEEDIPNPVNYYGKTRLEAEKIILSASNENVILRSAVIYGWHKKSRFTNWILQTLKENRIVDTFIDQYNTPTLVDDLAKSILYIIKKNISGLYHAAGKTCINRYEFAVILAETFNLNKNLIKPVTSAEKKQDAPRPISTCLDSTKLEKLINFNFNDIKDGVSVIFKKSQNASRIKSYSNNTI